MSSSASIHTIIAIGPLIGSNQQQTFAIEGPLYTPNNGSTLQAMIQALGTVDTIDLSGATVTQTVSAQAISIYTYEMEQNEAKRKIKLLRKEYVAQFEKELRKSLETVYV